MFFNNSRQHNSISSEVLGGRAKAKISTKRLQLTAVIYVKHGEFNSGIMQDAELVKKLLVKKLGDEKLVKICDVDQIHQAKITIHIEHINTNGLGIKGRTIHIWIPNQELISDWDIKNINKIDYIFCKTHITEKVISDLKPTGKILYTGFASLNQTGPIENPPDKDRNLIVHFAGTSRYKNTNHLIETWKKYNGFNPDLKLLISYAHGNYDLPFQDYEISGKTLNCMKIEPNIYMTKRIPKDLYQYYLYRASIALCPSAAEGFGHYINEAAMNGIIPITLDKPPMNELVDKNLLIPAKQVGRVSDLTPWIYLDKSIPAEIYDYSDEDFASKFRQVLDSDRQKLADKVQNDYLTRTAEFAERWNNVMNDIDSKL